MKSSHIAAAALATVIIPFAAQASAADDVVTGFYLGGGLTQSRFDDDNFSVADIDEEDNSWKAIAGFRFHESFSVEANYIDFGRATAPTPPGGTAFDAEAKAFAVYGVGYLPLPWFDLFAKAGVAKIDGEGRFAGALFEDDETEFAYGGGLQIRLSNLAIRAEYEKFDTDVVGDLDLITLGVTYTFGSR